MRAAAVITAVVLFIGGPTGGLVGSTNFDGASTLFDSVSPTTRTVYLLVGFVGAYQALQWRGVQRRWLATACTVRA